MSEPSVEWGKELKLSHKELSASFEDQKSKVTTALAEIHKDLSWIKAIGGTVFGLMVLIVGGGVAAYNAIRGDVSAAAAKVDAIRGDVGDFKSEVRKGFDRLEAKLDRLVAPAAEPRAAEVPPAALAPGRSDEHLLAVEVDGAKFTAPPQGRPDGPRKLMWKGRDIPSPAYEGFATSGIVVVRQRTGSGGASARIQGLRTDRFSQGVYLVTLNSMTDESYASLKASLSTDDPQLIFCFPKK